MGVMALHIAYRGEHPTFFYGQNYMGTLQAYIGAGLFHIFSPSLFSLRLGLILLHMLFLICMYLLVSLLYSKGWALVSLALLGPGSSYVIARELSAIGGYPETLFFGSLAFLLASWLALSYRPGMPLRGMGWRFVMYAGWGLAAGLGLWSDLLVAPFVVMSGLLILLVCWRELRQGLPGLCLIGGLSLGIAPLLYYNLHAVPGQDSLAVLAQLRDAGHTQLHYTRAVLTADVKNTVLISVPLITGNPFCPVNELAFLGPTSPHSTVCSLMRGSWGVGYLMLFAVAILLACAGLWRAWRRMSTDKTFLEGRHEMRRRLAHFLLLGSGILTLLLYTFSAGPLDWPGIHGRYIIGLLVVMPAIFWPLWQGMRVTTMTNLPGDAVHFCAGESRVHTVGVQATFDLPRRYRHILSGLIKSGSGAILVVVSAILLTGTIMAFGELPGIQARNQQDQALIDDLGQAGITHIYTDYWTCYKIAFLSNERIICGVIDNQLEPTKYNRYQPYYDAVKADPHAAYVFAPAGLTTYAGYVSPIQKFSGRRFKELGMDGYVVYVPS